MTYRERRERRAERLRGWAEKHEASAAATRQAHEPFRGDHAFNFQPANAGSQLHRMRQRVNAQAERAFTDERTAETMSSRADEIDRQAGRAIYSDDPDAIERLQARIAELEAERESVKAENAAFRKAHDARLRELTAYQRSQAMPHPPYVLQNLGGNITRQRKRLAQLEREQTEGAPERRIHARYAGECADCGAPIECGQLIRYSRTTGARCSEECRTPAA